MPQTGPVYGYQRGREVNVSTAGKDELLARLSTFVIQVHAYSLQSKRMVVGPAGSPCEEAEAVVEGQRTLLEQVGSQGRQGSLEGGSNPSVAAARHTLACPVEGEEGQSREVERLGMEQRHRIELQTSAPTATRKHLPW